MSYKNSSTVIRAILAVALFQAHTLFAMEPTVLIPPMSSEVGKIPVAAVLEDEDGALWIGTQQGVFRYDGDTSRKYSRIESSDGYLAISDVRGITTDMFGRVIVATFSGEYFRFSHVKDGFEEIAGIGIDQLGSVVSLQELKSDSLLMTGSRDSVILSKELRPVFRVSQLLKGTTEELVGMISIDDDNFLAATSDGVYRLDLAGKYKKTGLQPESDSQFTFMSAMGADRAMLTDNRGLVRIISTKTQSVLETFDIPALASSDVTALTVYGEYLVIGTDDGVLALQMTINQLHVFTEENSALQSNHISGLFLANRQLWIATYQGLHVLTLSSFKSFNRKSSNGLSDVLAFAEGPNDQLFIGAFNGIYRLGVGDTEHVNFDENVLKFIRGKPIIALEVIGDDLWIGSWRGGLAAIDISGDNNPAREVKALRQAQITDLSEDEYKNLWVTTYESGIYRIETTTGNVRHFLPKESLTLVHISEAGLIVAGPEAVYMYDPQFEIFTPLNLEWTTARKLPFVLSIATLPNGETLFGTKDQGIFRSGGKVGLDVAHKLSPLIDRNSLGGFTANAMIVESDSSVWVATSNGLLRIDPSSGRFSKYGKAFGIQNLDFNANAGFMDSRGAVHFGGPSGYTTFRPGDVADSRENFPLVLTRMETITKKFQEHSSLSSIDLVQLDYDVRAVTLYFSTQDFLNVADYSYRHQLQNFDPTWIEDRTRNSATYTNLPAGDYVFKVQAADSTGAWIEEAASINLRVLPPPWKTWWAYTLYSIAAITFLWFAKRAYDNQLLKERAIQYAQEVSNHALRIEDELQESDEFYDEQVEELQRQEGEMLALVKNVVLSPLEDQHLARKLEVLALLNESPYSTADPLSVNLRGVVDELAVRYLAFATVPSETITVINAVQERPVERKYAAPLALAIAELLENALTHAFGTERKANYIEIHLQFEGDPNSASYCLQVKDDGVGLPDDLVINEATPGLAMLDRITKFVGGEIEQQSEYGTSVVLRVPVRQHA